MIVLYVRLTVLLSVVFILVFLRDFHRANVLALHLGTISSTYQRKRVRREHMMVCRYESDLHDIDNILSVCFHSGKNRTVGERGSRPTHDKHVGETCHRQSHVGCETRRISWHRCTLCMSSSCTNLWVELTKHASDRYLSCLEEGTWA